MNYCGGRGIHSAALEVKLRHPPARFAPPKAVSLTQAKWLSRFREGQTIKFDVAVRSFLPVRLFMLSGSMDHGVW
jgi:hypothetical protein